MIGYAISKRIDGQLAKDALRMALLRCKPPCELTHRSDCGVQYLCDDYVQVLEKHGFHASCSAKGNPCADAWMESFTKTLKYDEVYMLYYATYLNVTANVPHFIEEVYNKKRLHSSMGFVPPEDFEELSRMNYKRDKNDPPSSYSKLHRLYENDRTSVQLLISGV